MTHQGTLPFSAPLTLQQLLDLGVTKAQVRGWLERGRITRVARGVYAPVDARRSPRRTRPQERHAVYAGDTPVPTLIAIEHHQLWLPRDIPPQLQSADGRRVIPAAFVQKAGRLLIPSLEWTAIQAARWQPLAGALLVFDSALRLGASRDVLLDIAVSLRFWPGTALLRRAILAADARSESPLESWSRGLMLQHELPMPVLQYEIRAQGFLMRCDFAYPDRRLILEADGRGKLGADAATQQRAILAERERQRRLERAGWTVMRWGWEDVHPHHAEWLRDIKHLLNLG